MPARDRHRMRRFGSHVVVLPKLLHAYQPSSLDRATSLGVIGPGYDPSGWLRAPRIRYVFVQARSALLSPADGSIIPICRSREPASLSSGLEIAKGALSDDAHDLKAKPANSGSLPASSNRERAPTALRTGLTCRTPDLLWYAACKRCWRYCRSSCSPPAPSRVLMARAADGSKSGRMGGGSRCATIRRRVRRRIPGAPISARPLRGTVCRSGGCGR